MTTRNKKDHQARLLDDWEARWAQLEDRAGAEAA